MLHRRKSSSAPHPQDAPPPGGSGRPPVVGKRFQIDLSPARVIPYDFKGPMKDLRFFVGDDFVKKFGVVLLLFETPSGFAIFGFHGIYLYKSDAIESIWAKFVHYGRAIEIVWFLEFQTFDDKSSAISVGTGIDKQLSEMIMKWLKPRQTLVVGKQEYKSIIESSLGIDCLHNDVVMEVMWGMQRLMHRLVPWEKSELPKEDRVPMSQGLQMLLSHHGFHVKPEMINEEIVVAALALFKFDAAKKEEYPTLRSIGRLRMSPALTVRIGQAGAAAAQVRGVGREEPGDGRGLHRHIPESPRRQEDVRPRAHADGHTAGLQGRPRRRRRRRAQVRRQPPGQHAAQARQEEVGLLWLLIQCSLPPPPLIKNKKGETVNRAAPEANT